MLAIGRALMARPKLLLLDEPSLGLAPQIVDDDLRDRRGRSTATGTTILLVEQNAHLALASRTARYVLRRAASCSTAAAKDLAKNDEIRKAYLGGA